MRIFDTLSGDKKELVQPQGRPLSIFVCGPTVYDYPHIGNARTFVFFDMFTRYLRSRGVSLNYLQNITNIDDKIIQRSIDEKIGWEDVARKYEDIYYTNLKSLGADTARMTFARATDFIPEIIAQVKRLREKGSAYKIDSDGWYFDLTTYADYGQLAKRTAQQAEDGVTRVDNSDKKKNAGDFCLWKFSKVGEPTWPSAELGAGRPGWHIEDTAITEKFFGPQYDVHGGAIDLKFPHHEAERAQQESASGKKPFVSIWMHAGFLTINGKKMSKSLGNFLTVDDLLKKISADAFRMMLLMHHYRSPLDYTDETAHAAAKTLSDLNTLLAKLAMAKGEPTKKKIDVVAFEKDFAAAMDDDFNTLKALAVLSEFTTAINKQIWNFSEGQAKQIAQVLVKTFAAFGIMLAAPVIPADVVALAHEREISRVNKQFANSDALRAKIEQLGYVVEDSPVGPLVLPKD